MLVPCNQCVMCKIQRSKDWAVRIMHESSYHISNVFITLTYDDEHLPKNGSLIGDEISKFIKRFRKHHPEKQIKYYGCGEYGEKYERPHYHIILFGVGPECFRSLGKGYNVKTKQWVPIYTHKAWTKGIIHVGYVEPHSARYVTDYVQKTYSRKMIKEVYGEKIQPYARQSKGIGKRWAEDNEIQIKQHYNVTMFGKDMGLCKYYRKILDIDGDKVWELAQKRRGDSPETEEEEWTRRMLNRYNWDTRTKFDPLPKPLEKIYEQRRINHEAKHKMLRKKDLEP